MVLNEIRWARVTLFLAVLGVAVLFPAVLLPRPAQAQEELSKRREEAKKLADSGYDLFKKGMYVEAGELFRKADKRFHSPMFVVFIADAEDKQQHLVEAHRLLKSVVDEALAYYAPDSFRAAKKKAQERLTALEERLPRVSFVLPPGELSFRLDDKPRSRAELGAPLPIDPGGHVAVVSDGQTSAERSFTAKEGSTVTVRLPALGEGPESPGGRSWVGPGIAFGIGGAGIVIGAVSGIVFMGRAGDLKDRCPDNQCKPEDESEGDEISTLGNVSTVGWVLGGLGVAAGVVLVLLPSGDSEGEPASGEASFRPELLVGPTSLQLRARF